MRSPHVASRSRNSGFSSAFVASTFFAALVVAATQFGAGCSSGGGGSEGSGGSTGSGGTTSSGGQTGSGGTTASGGAVGTGGKVGSGGTTGSGGSGSGGNGSGGSTGSGGSASGGATGSGGATASGGTTASGGAAGGTASGGAGGKANGGATGTGGVAGRQGGSGGMGGAAPSDKGGAGVLPLNITLTSTQVTEGSPFPSGITCADSSMGSPDLTWTAGPSGTMSYAVTLTDLNNNLVHWAIWNIPSSTMSLPAKLATTAMLTTPAGAQQLNFQNGNGYYGPCPMGTIHYYQFRVYALSVATLPGSTPTMTTNAKATIVQNAIGSGALTGTSNANRM